MHDLLGAANLSFATVFSIVMSCLSIATITTGMFFDYDTDPASRVHSPMFYGAVPDSTMRKLLVRVPMRATPACGRTSSRFAFMQVSLFLFVLAHAAGKLATIPLLLKTSLAALPAYLCGAMALYLLYKLARRDLQYWCCCRFVKCANLSNWQERVCPFVKCLDRMDFRAVRSSSDEYRDQRHRSKRTNSMRTRGELGKANADVSKS
jgi:hypothetical protein